MIGFGWTYNKSGYIPTAKFISTTQSHAIVKEHALFANNTPIKDLAKQLLFWQLLNYLYELFYVEHLVIAFLNDSCFLMIVVFW